MGSRDTAWNVRWFFNSDGVCDSVIDYYKYGAGLWNPFKKNTLRYNEIGQLTYMETQTGRDNASHSWSNLNGDARARFYFEVANGTGVNDLRTSLQFSIYPNPVQNQIHIQSGSAVIKFLSVYDLTGRILIQQKVSGYSNGEIILQLGSLPAGLYTLRADGVQVSGSKKFIVY